MPKNELGQDQNIGDIIIAFNRGWVGVQLGVIRGFTPGELEQIVVIDKPSSPHNPVPRTYHHVVSIHSPTIVINDATLFELFGQDGRAQKAKEVQFELKADTYEKKKK